MAYFPASSPPSRPPSLHSLAAVPAFARRRPVVTAAISYIAISYAAPPLIRSFINTNEQNDDAHRPFRAMDLLYPSTMCNRFFLSMMERYSKVTETDESVVWSVHLFGSVKKEEVEVIVDHNTLTFNDGLPGRIQFTGTIDLTGKHCDVVHTTATLKSNVLEIVVPKLKKKEDVEDEDDDRVIHVNVD